MKLQVSTPHSGNIFNIWMGYQGKEALEKIKMGMNSKESFAQMHKNRYMKDGIEGQVMKLDSPMKQ